jgi:hypothetical protein
MYFSVSGRAIFLSHFLLIFQSNVCLPAYFSHVLQSFRFSVHPSSFPTVCFSRSQAVCSFVITSTTILQFTWLKYYLHSACQLVSWPGFCLTVFQFSFSVNLLFLLKPISAYLTVEVSFSFHAFPSSASWSLSQALVGCPRNNQK